MGMSMGMAGSWNPLSMAGSENPLAAPGYQANPWSGGTPGWHSSPFGPSGLGGGSPGSPLGSNVWRKRQQERLFSEVPMVAMPGVLQW